MIILDMKLPNEYPNSCTGCNLDSYCRVYDPINGRCPIKAEIPDEHGDLIDKQKLIRDIEAIEGGDEHTRLKDKWAVRTAPTILGRTTHE